jgi:hypothetical protein
MGGARLLGLLGEGSILETQEFKPLLATDEQ